MLRARYANTSTIELARQLGCKLHIAYAKANKLGLKKSVEFLASEQSGRVSKSNNHGSAKTRFTKGHQTWSKGKLGLDMGGRSHDTRFRKGERPRNWMPIGAHRVNSLGYLDRKVSEHRRGGLNWTAVHRLVWIEAHGPIPRGHVLTFRPGRRSVVLAQITLDAIELITRKEHARRNSYHTNYPAAIGELIRLKGQITRQIRRREREEQDRGLAQSPVRDARGAEGSEQADGHPTREGDR